MPDKPSKPKHAGLTRRQWLLRLGEATALVGWSGELGPALTDPADAGKDAATPGLLPPGLYEPSTAHLAHAYRSDGAYRYIPPGSETDYVQPQVNSYRPVFFTPTEFAVVRRITELMLGEAATGAGAVDVNAAELGQTLAEWVDLSVSSAAGVRRAARALDPAHRILASAVEGEDSVRRMEEYRPEPICREGLRWLEANAKAKCSRSFLALAAIDQIELLHSIGDENSTPEAGNPGRELFNVLKREVIRGYYTSRAGLAELDYKGNAFYAESPGCGRQS